MTSVLVADQVQMLQQFKTTVGFTLSMSHAHSSEASMTSLSDASTPSSSPEPSPIPIQPTSSLPGTPAPRNPAARTSHALPTKSHCQSSSNPCLSSSMKSSFTPPSIHAAANCNSPDGKHVGWQGLLEISRNSGTSGVMFAKEHPSRDNSSREMHQATQLEVCATAHTNAAIRRLVKSVVRGLKAEQEPAIPEEGMGGTYFFANENGRKVAILKPCDEEPLAPNNPKGYVGRQLGDPGWKPTVRVGEAAMREVAAYLLDHDGFAKVPTSVLVRARHPVFCYNNRMSSVRASCLDLSAVCEPLPMKLGSLQEFVAHECDTSEMGPSRFSVDDVHRIGILDIRLFNTDRHAGNMLVLANNSSKSSAALLSHRIYSSTAERELIPIDHGFCLPETLEAPYFEWMHWPQAMQPFSEEELRYIKDLDIDADMELLHKELPNLRPECLRVLELGTTLLKLGAEQGLNLYEIAHIMSRPYGEVDEEPSPLERLCLDARREMEAMSDPEASGEEDDDFDESEEEDELEEEEDLFFDDKLMDGCVEGARGAGGVGNPQEGLENMFQLEEEVGTARSGIQSLPCSGGGLARSPSQYTESSCSSGGISDVDTAVSSRFRPRGALGTTACSSMGLSSSVGTSSSVGLGSAGPISMAKSTKSGGGGVVAASACGTGGYLYRHMSKRQMTTVRKQGGRRIKVKSKGCLPKQVYPPPVLAAAPDTSVVSFSDMDQSEWEIFMGRVTKALCKGMSDGTFRKDPLQSVASF